MKLTLEREVFAKKLQSSLGAIGNSMIPVLNETLFQFKNGRLFITSSNGEVQLTVSMKCEVEGEPEDFVCDGRLFLTPANTLKSKEVVIELSDETVSLATSRTKNRYEAPITYQPENYPILSSDNWSEPLQVKGSIFSNMIKKSSMFVDKDNIRSGMRGVSMMSNGDILTIESIASSGNVICHLEALPSGDEKFAETPQVLIPKAIDNVATEFEKSPSVNISIDGQKKCLRINDKMSIVTLRLLDGVFPDCSPFINMYTPEINAKMLTEDLSLALKRSGAFSDEHSLTRIDMRGDEVEIECENTSFKKKSKEFISVSHKSDEMNFEFGVNLKYLSKTLLTMSGENIFISMLGHNKNLYISDDSSEGFNTLWVIAPMVLPKKQ